MFLFQKNLETVPEYIRPVIISEVHGFLKNISQGVQAFELDFNEFTMEKLEMPRCKQALDRAAINLDNISSKWNAKNSVSVSLSRLLQLYWDTYFLNIEWRKLTLDEGFDLNNNSHKEKYQFYLLLAVKN